MKTALTYAWRAGLIFYLLGVLEQIPFGRTASYSDLAAGFVAGVILGVDQLMVGLVLGALAGAFVAWRRRA